MPDPLAQAEAVQLATRFLSPGEALLLLVVLTGALFLGISVTMATWTLIFRSRKLDRAKHQQDLTGRWQFELREVLYGEESPESLSASVDDENRVEFLNFLLQYVRRLEGEEQDTIRALAENHLAKITEYVSHPVEARRARAVQTLGELGLPAFADEVIAALDDPSPDVAMVAASTLSAADEGVYADPVLAHLDRFAHWRLDFLAAMLASMGPEAAPALRWALADAEVTPNIRAVAADALALLGDAPSADLADDVLANTQQVELRAAALRLLAAVGRGEHVDSVRKAVGDPSLPVRLHAVRALGGIGAEEDRALLEDTAKSDPSPWVAIAAARGLKEAGGISELERLAGSHHPRAALGLQVISEVRSW